MENIIHIINFNITINIFLRIATAIDGAVGDVFRASFKMAVFHGLWAWLIHTLFGVKVVYLPSGKALFCFLMD